jgi:hypothetical protein
LVRHPGHRPELNANPALTALLARERDLAVVAERPDRLEAVRTAQEARWP